MPTPLDRDFIEFARICAVARVHGAVGPIMMCKGVIDLVNVLPQRQRRGRMSNEEVQKHLSRIEMLGIQTGFMRGITYAAHIMQKHIDDDSTLRSAVCEMLKPSIEELHKMALEEAKQPDGEKPSGTTTLQ